MVTLGFSKVYYSKVDPYEIYDISSNVSGLVLYTKENMIGKKLSHKPYIRIDSELDEKELKYIKDKLKFLNEMIVTNKKMLSNLKKSLEKKQRNYNKIKVLKIKSVVEKNREFYDLVSSKNQLLSTKKDIQNLKVQITDLKLRRVQLKKSVSDKKISANGLVLYSIAVKAGQVVGVATPLAKVADTSKAKLTIYLDEEDVLDAKNMSVYIDGKKSAYKISRLLNIADSKNISKYMAQIIIKPPKLFSKLVKIELKNE
ncbi:HlyD family efflux transporter periplasmic adaptor subunit [Sulfurimonas sp.]